MQNIVVPILQQPSLIQNQDFTGGGVLMADIIDCFFRIENDIVPKNAARRKEPPGRWTRTLSLGVYNYVNSIRNYFPRFWQFHHQEYDYTITQSQLVLKWWDFHKIFCWI